MSNNTPNSSRENIAAIKEWIKPQLTIISISQETLGGPDPLADLGVGSPHTS
jgi:hypothetical protein